MNMSRICSYHEYDDMIMIKLFLDFSTLLMDNDYFKDPKYMK